LRRGAGRSQRTRCGEHAEDEARHSPAPYSVCSVTAYRSARHLTADEIDQPLRIAPWNGGEVNKR
jgi:hypothetical protein